MGLGDLFRRRRERESAIPSSGQAEQRSEALGSFASPDGQPVIGEPVGDGQPGSAGLANIAGAADGLAALARHGIDPGASGTSLNFQIEPKDE